MVHSLRVLSGVLALLTPCIGASGSERDNFAMPSSHDLAAWKRTLERLRATHDELRKAIADPTASMERLHYHLGHDCYHLGQIMYLRAMQGLPPIE